MTTLAANQPRDYLQGDFHDYPVIATDIIYQGAAVGDNGSGYARPLVAGDPFRGFADIKADNSAGVAGAEYVRCRTRGDIQLAISGLAITDVGKDVYASDDNTFTLTAGSNTRIGHVHSFVSSGVGIVRFAATTGVMTELTDSTGGVGTRDTTLADGLTAVAPAEITAYAAVVNMTDPVTKAEGEAVSAALKTLRDEVAALRIIVNNCVSDLTVQNQNDSDLTAAVNTIIRRLGN